MPIKELYAGQEPISADIVFVHGLRGSLEDTWKNGAIIWPRDLLPKDLPHARVISWGYDSNIAQFFHQSSQNSLFSHANNLLIDIAHKRRRTEERLRPIVFVGHSLGGLVIKAALLRSANYLHTRQDERLGAIYDHLHGIIFLGTPHRGSHLTPWGEVLKTVAKLALRQPNDDLLRTLSPDSDILQDQRDRFSGIIENITVACFFEELPTGAGMVVAESSACFEGFRVRKNSIPANHMDMCKFAEAESDGYGRVLYYLIDFVESAEACKSVPTPSESVLSPSAPFINNERFPLSLRPPRSSHFVGRASELENLDTCLRARSEAIQPTSCIIYGLAGVGKTKLALEYSYRYDHAFRIVAWINAGSGEELLWDFFNLGQRLGLYDSHEVCDIPHCNTVKLWLQSINISYLLIFDNVQDYSQISGYVPETSAGKLAGIVQSIIIITQCRDIGDHDCPRILLDRPMTEDALGILYRYLESNDTSKPDRNTALKAIDSVGRVPLFIAAVGISVSGSVITLEDALPAIQEAGGHWIYDISAKQLSYDRHPHSAFKSALSSIRSMAASNLVHILALLDGERIPDKLLFNDQIDKSLRILANQEVTPITYSQIIQSLERHSLVQHVSQSLGGYLSINKSLQQEILRDLYSGSSGFTIEHIVEQSLAVVQHVTPAAPIREPVSSELQIAYSTIIPHLLSLGEKGHRCGAINNVEFARLLVNAGLVMWYCGHITKGLRLLTMAESILSSLENWDTPLRGDLETGLGLLKRENGVQQRVNSEHRMNNALRIQELADDGEERLPLLAAQSEHASAMLEMRSVEKADLALHSALRTLEAQGLETSYTFIQLLHRIAFSCIMQGNLDKASTMARRISAIKTTGNYRCHRLDFGLACILFQLGSYSQSLDLHYMVLHYRQKSFGDSSVLTVTSTVAVAAALECKGDLDLARNMLEEAWHRATALTGKELAAHILFHLGRFHVQYGTDKEGIQGTGYIEQARALLGELLPGMTIKEFEDDIESFSYLLPVFEGRFMWRSGLWTSAAQRKH